MKLGTNSKGQKVLFRCNCSHDWHKDDIKYVKRWFPYRGLPMGGSMGCGFTNYCPECKKYGWRVVGLNDQQLTERGRKGARISG